MKKQIFRFGSALTRYGEKHNIRLFIYNPITWGRFFFSARKAGAIFATVVRDVFPETRTVLDVGAGSGGYVAKLKKTGISAMGMEYSAAGRLLAKLQGARVYPFDCSRPDTLISQGRFDLVYSIEVGEHIPIGFASRFVEYIASHGDTIVFSAAYPGQGGQGHINEQPKEYWTGLFRESGFNRSEYLENQIATKLQEHGYQGWLPHNIQVFEKTKF